MRRVASTPIGWVTPFAALLGAIAVLPLAAPRWWHSNRNKALVALAAGLPVMILLLVQNPRELGHVALDYAAFMALLGSLYIVSGGVLVEGGRAATTFSNVMRLAGGAVLANLVGTTGAAMLLIRPLLAANRARASRVHLVVFFILIVANCGGLLTPLGDPPLFLGFLKGVPFSWTLRLWKPWLFVNGALLAVFVLVDRRRAGTPGLPEKAEPFAIKGYVNLILLWGVVGTVLAGGFLVHPRWGESAAKLFQTVTLALLAGVSWAVTPKGIRAANGFSWHPFVEVVALFAGIFASMTPAIEILGERGPAMGIERPWQFFWATGLLSGFLDNAPTYVAFLSVGQFLPDEVAGTSHAALAAISCGAVFFGAATYIGNGPNFMVKAIADHEGIRMPSFFGYLAWSAAILGPILAAATLLFFRTV